ncbi:MAG: DUF4340 domain-containing protein [Drouetiella hepatica Uher 2000/2452]|jgi:hypothetical protein|uniref:DUF4340 domain-containing protein n=1 Tax=Drouetiella hepatica Uher 2000/2452 TaxID=904376 RepID=A0A951UK59_9CYAN|nr:DUF4340 domain-containing protein [Drouetiella hepatica Uher 2000/2452]
MKLKPSTLLLILTALLLGGVVLLVQTQPPPSQTQADEPQNLFAFQESQVQSLTLKTLLRSLKFERDSSGKWQMLEPEKAIASDPSLSFLLNLVATGKSQRSFTAPAGDREQYSFHQPLATIDVTLANKETHQLILGGYDFNRTNLYALVDPPTDPKADLKVLLVSPNFDNAVNRSVDDWKQTESKPSPSSPTPSISPSSSPSSPSSSPSSPSPSPSSPSPSGESPEPEEIPEIKLSPSSAPESSVTPQASP